MQNKNPCSPTLKGVRSSASIRLQKRNILCRDCDQVNLLEEHNTRLLLCRGTEKHCEEGIALRLDRIVVHSLYPHLFTKHQQKVLKEALEECRERLYDK